MGFALSALTPAVLALLSRARPAAASTFARLVPELWGWLALLLGLVVVLWLAHHHRPAADVLLAAFTVRALAALANRYMFTLPLSGADAMRFETRGWQWGKQGLAVALGHFTTGDRLYSWVIAVLYAATARSPLLIQAINVLLGTLIVWNVYQIALALWGPRPAIAAAWATALFPTGVVYSAIIMREVQVIYPVTLAALCLVRWEQGGGLRWLAFCLLALAVGVAFHMGVLAAFIAPGLALVLRWLGAARTGRHKEAVRNGLALALLSLCLLLMLSSGWGLSKLRYSLSNLTLERLRSAEETKAQGRASYLEDLRVNGPLDLAWQTPVRTAFFLYTPFPWMRLQPVDLPALGDALLFLAFTIAIARAGRRILRVPAARGVIAMLVVLLIAYALPTSNYGTALRHRGKLAPLAIALAAAAIPASERSAMGRPCDE